MGRTRDPTGGDPTGRDPTGRTTDPKPWSQVVVVTVVCLPGVFLGCFLRALTDLWKL